MERNIQRNGLINLLILLAVGVAGFAVAHYTNSFAGQVCSVFLALGLMVAAVSWFQMRLEDRERLEKLELDELARAHGGSALFEAREADVFPAQRSREQFERFFVPVFTVILCLVEAGGAWLLWRWLSRGNSLELKEPMMGMFLFFLFALVLFIIGRFSATYARLEDARLLRPGASFLLLNAVLCAAVGGGIVGVLGGFSKTDLYVGYVLCGLLAVVAIETLIALVLEMYRPRVKGKVQRPLYDSRLVGLLGQPEGLVTTAAQAIDYQFGFKVSETWFYRFFERALLWLVPLQLFLLLLSTSFVVIEPGEQALLERFGSPVQGRSLLGPGAHFKWPWPIDKVYRYQTEQIQTFNIGFTPDPEKENEPAVLWTVAHTKEDNFLIANHDQSSLNSTNEATGKRTPPVSLLTVSIPVQFQITNLEAWAYNNGNASALLQDIGVKAALVAFAEQAGRQGDFKRSLDALVRLQKIVTVEGDKQEEHKLLISLAQANAAMGDRRAALTHLERAAQLFPNDATASCEREKVRGLIEYFARDFRGSAAACERAIDLARTLGLTYEVAVNLHNLGDILIRLADFARAYGALQQSLALCDEAGYERLASHNRMFLAYLDALNGDMEAEKRLTQGIRYAEANDFTWDVIGGRALLAQLLLRRGDLAGARADLERLRTIAEEAGNSLIVEDCAQALRALGPAPAVNALDEA